MMWDKHKSAWINVPAQRHVKHQQPQSTQVEFTYNNTTSQKHLQHTRSIYVNVTKHPFIHQTAFICFPSTPKSPLKAWLKLHFHYNTRILKEDVDVKEGTARVSYFPASNKNILNNIICTICSFFRPKATSVLLRKESPILKQTQQTNRRRVKCT